MINKFYLSQERIYISLFIKIQSIYENMKNDFVTALYETYNLYARGKISESTRYRKTQEIKKIYKQDKIPKIFSYIERGHDTEKIKDEIIQLARDEIKVRNNLVYKEITKEEDEYKYLDDRTRGIILFEAARKNDNDAKEYLRELYKQKYLTEEQAYEIYNQSRNPKKTP